MDVVDIYVADYTARASGLSRLLARTNSRWYKAIRASSGKARAITQHVG